VAEGAIQHTHGVRMPMHHAPHQPCIITALQCLHARCIPHSCGSACTRVRVQDVVAARGEGSWVWTSDGRRLLDFASGIGVTSTGHCHPTVVMAVQEQAARVCVCVCAYACAAGARVACVGVWRGEWAEGMAPDWSKDEVLEYGALHAPSALHYTHLIPARLRARTHYTVRATKMELYGRFWTHLC
jgi:hypothetical protein